MAWFNRIGGDGTLGLWQTDGTAAGSRQVWGGPLSTLVDIARTTPRGTLYFGSSPGQSLHRLFTGASEPQTIAFEPGVVMDVGEIFSLGESMLAVMNDGRRGKELYVVDPDSDRPRLVFEFVPGPGGGIDSAQFAPFAGGAVFAARTDEHGFEPWFTDGTPEGTRMLADVNPGALGSSPYRFTESGGRLYFSAQTALHGRELWVYDPALENARMVADFAPGPAHGDPYSQFAHGDGLFFVPHDPDRGEELWFTGGLPDDARLWYEFVPGPEGGEPHGLARLGDRIVFAAGHPEFGRVLWETDGTPEGTRPLFESLQGEPAPAPPPAAWARYGNEKLIALYTPEYGTELWATDTTTGASRLVRDINPGPGGSHPRQFFEFGEHLYFVADDGIHGIELWRTDGTEHGTAWAHDAYPGAGSGNPRFLTIWGGQRFAFVADREEGPHIFYYESALGEFRKIEAPLHAVRPWQPVDLRPGPEDTLEFSVQNAAGETTLWQTNGYDVTRLPVFAGVGPAR